MTAKTRTTYFLLWRRVCAAQGWEQSDAARRHEVTRYCMREVGAMETDSITQLGHHEITALFCLLRHLANPTDLDTVGEWERCKGNYKDFNRVRQARHKLRTVGYRDHGKLDEQRFDGAMSAKFPEALPDSATVRELCITAGARTYRLDPSRKFTKKPFVTGSDNEPF